jgi:hypothetical protein
MQTYIGVKLVEAEPAKALKSSGTREKDAPGYSVKYPDGYMSWCPKEVFEKANLPIQGTANKIHPGDVEAMISHYGITSLGGEDGRAKVTVVVCTLINGFTITESSSCVDPANYDEQIGADICMEKIKDKIWFLLGFLLQSAVNGFDWKEVV